MRPDVALSFDRMAVAARSDGVALLIASAFAAMPSRRGCLPPPDPQWVAPPGKSFTENAI
jgi:hypothetical protein